MIEKFFVPEEAMELVSGRIANYANWISIQSTALKDSMLQLINSVVTAIEIVLMVALLSYFDYLLSIIVFAIGSVIFLIPLIFEKCLEKLGAINWELKEGLYSKLQSILAGYSIFLLSARNFAVPEIVKKIFKQGNRKIVNNETKLETLYGLSSLWTWTLYITVDGITAFWIYKEFIPLAAIMIVTFFVGISIEHMSSITQNIIQIIKNKSLLRKIQPSSDTNSLLYNNEAEETKKLPPLTELSFVDVTLSYGKKIILHNLNLSFKNGKKYVVVAPSGTGKTSLILAIVGLLKPKKGAIYWNNKNYKTISIYELLNRVQVVLNNFPVQEVTLKENICFADHGDNNVVKKILKKLRLDESLLLNQKISSENVSTGQAQRVSIARAMLQTKNLLILDEALSNVDATTRLRIEEEFLKNEDITLINITHNHENLQKYDYVIDLTRFNCG